ncbi:hypothetical protein [Saccharopolyspora sp. NPDC002376]
MTRFDLQDGGPDLLGLERSLTATHEAGHAIIAVLFGLQVTEIKIWRSGHSYAGHVLTPIDEDNHDDLTASLHTAVAGHEAEALWRANHLKQSRGAAIRDSRPGCKHDMAAFREYRRLGKDLPTETAARQLAHRQLVTHWSRIERLADRLTRAGHLTTV